MDTLLHGHSVATLLICARVHVHNTARGCMLALLSHALFDVRVWISQSLSIDDDMEVLSKSQTWR